MGPWGRCAGPYHSAVDERQEHRPPGSREEAQLTALRTLLGRIAANPFQAPRLAAAGLGPERLPDLDAWRGLAPTRKEELAADQAAVPPYGTNLSEPLERYVRVHQTSSTTGRPLRWLDTAEDWAWMRRGWRRVLEAAGIGPADRALFAFSFGPFIGFWLGFEAAQDLGCLTLPGGALDSRGRLELMRAQRVTVLGCTPTYALRLGEVAREAGLGPDELPVRALVVAGEPGGCVPATRARLEQLWNGARVFDHYGMTEVGPVSHQVPDEPGRVVLDEDHYLCELLEPDGDEPVEPDGERLAELVLTPLGRSGMPVLRYRTGDLVVAEARTGDGAPLTLRGGIRTRASQRVVVRGVNLYPSAFEEVLRRAGGVAEYRVEIDRRGSMAEARVEVELEPGRPPGDLARLEEALRDAFHLRVPVHAAAAPLPRFELKARRWVVLEP